MNTLEVCGSAQALAQAVSDRLPATTSQTARELYRVLVEVSVSVEQRRGHAATVTESVIHLPIELVADTVGISRVTLWRHLPQLKALGLVDCRTHKASWRGADRLETRNSGTVWRVRLSPLRGAKARVSADDLRHRWRGKEMRGAASRQTLKHIQSFQERSVKLSALVQWAVNPTQKTPVAPLGFKPVKPGLEALLDVLKAPNQKMRFEAVDLGARALASALSDQTGLNFYRLLLWNLLRRHTVTGEDFTYAVYLTALRARVDVQEGFARRGGALFTSRLKAASWFSEMMAAPPVKIGTEFGIA